MIAEFTEVYTLPDTHIQSAFSDRYAQTITCQGRFGMGGHVVISFAGMHIVGFPFFHQVVEDGLHIGLDIRISIFIDAKPGAGMLDEQMQESGLRQARQITYYFIRYQVKTTCTGT